LLAVGKVIEFFKEIIMSFLPKEKTNWKYILTVFILATIVGGGILVYLRNFEKEMISTTTFPEIKRPEKVEKETSKTEETANWKTYKNEDYGFEVKYPEGWVIEEGKIGDESPSPVFSIHKEEENPEKEIVSFIDILPEGFPRALPDDVNIERKELYFAGKKAVTDRFLTKEGEVWLEVIFIKDANLPPKWTPYNYIVISPKSNLTTECAVQLPPGEECGYGEGRIYIGEVDQGDWKQLNQIISTFRFLK
jgi:hypothetical protein